MIWQKWMCLWCNSGQLNSHMQDHQKFWCLNQVKFILTPSKRLTVNYWVKAIKVYVHYVKTDSCDRDAEVPTDLVVDLSPHIAICVNGASNRPLVLEEVIIISVITICSVQSRDRSGISLLSGCLRHQKGWCSEKRQKLTECSLCLYSRYRKVNKQHREQMQDLGRRVLSTVRSYHLWRWEWTLSNNRSLSWRCSTLTKL